MERARTALPGVTAESCADCRAAAAGSRCEVCGAALRAGDYRIRGLIAKSAHSRVYVAEGPTGKVALKELAFAFVPSMEQVEAFEREGELLAQLTHPRIPRFLGAFREGEGAQIRLYLAQELVLGQPLDRLLEEHHFGEDEVRRLCEQVLEVLAYLQSRSPAVLHRDIKPANLIRRADGEVVLVDFGVARSILSPTHHATLVGTFGYVPPEQLGGTVDLTSDLYALGVTLIHLLTRVSPESLLVDGLELRFEPHLQVSRRFAAFLRRLVARERPKRFPNARTALQSLRRATPSWGARGLVGSIGVVALGLATLWGLPPGSLRPVSKSVRIEAPRHPPGPGGVLLRRVVPEGQSGVDKTLARLEQSGRQPLAHQLREVLSRYGTPSGSSPVVLVRVTSESVPERVLPASFLPLSEGFLVGRIQPQSSLQVRVHGYAPVELRPTHRPTDAQWFIDVPLPPLRATEVGRVRGRIRHPDLSEAVNPQVHFAPVGAAGSALGTGLITDQGVVHPSIRAEVRPDGSFEATGFSPADYDVSARADGLLRWFRRVRFERGQLLDLGEIIPERPVSVLIHFAHSRTPRFREAALRSQVIQGGARWSATSEPLPGDLRFEQRSGRLSFDHAYGGSRLVNLGPGKLSEYLGVDGTAYSMAPPREVPLVYGHVYLLQVRADRWVLFSLEQPAQVLVGLEGTWRGADWGEVRLTTSGGSYTDTYGTGPGRIDLREVGPHQFAGTWGEGPARHGTLQLTLSADGRVITGTWSADRSSRIRPGTPVDASLRWAR